MTTGHWQISVSGPGGFFANGENGELDAILPRAGAYTFEIGPCAVWGNPGMIEISRGGARMSVATCGTMCREVAPRYRCAHPGYAFASPRAESFRITLVDRGAMVHQIGVRSDELLERRVDVVEVDVGDEAIDPGVDAGWLGPCT